MEFNSFGPAVGRLGSDSSRGGPSRSRGAKVEAGGAEPPLTLTTDCSTFLTVMIWYCTKLSTSTVNHTFAAQKPKYILVNQKNYGHQILANKAMLLTYRD